jgi:hypothetical protein
MTYLSSHTIWQSNMAIENPPFIAIDIVPLEPPFIGDVQLPRLITGRYMSSSVYTLRVRACVFMNVDEYGVYDALLIFSILCFICVSSVSDFLSTLLNMHHLCQCEWWLWGARADTTDWEVAVESHCKQHDSWIVSTNPKMHN